MKVLTLGILSAFLALSAGVAAAETAPAGTSTGAAATDTTQPPPRGSSARRPALNTKAPADTPVTPKKDDECLRLLKIRETREPLEVRAAAGDQLSAMDPERVLSAYAYALTDNEMMGYVVLSINSGYVADRRLAPFLATCIRASDGAALRSAVEAAMRIPDRRLVGALIEHALDSNYEKSHFEGIPGNVAHPVYDTVYASTVVALYYCTEGKIGTKQQLQIPLDRSADRTKNIEAWHAWWKENKAAWEAQAAPAATSTIAPAAVTVTPTAAPAGLTATLASAGDWLVGNPVWVAATFRNTTSHDMPGPQQELYFLCFGYRYKLVTEGGKVVAEGSVKARAERNTVGEGRGVQWPSYSVGAGKELRLLFRIKWPEGLVPGQYDLAVSFDGVEAMATSKIRVREPDEQEGKILRRLATEGVASPGAVLAEGEAVPAGLEKTYGFEFLVRRLLAQVGRPELDAQNFNYDPQLQREAAKKLVAKIDEKTLRLGSTDFYDPEIRVLQYEVLLAKEGKEEAAKLRKETLETFPGVARLFDQADKGNGVIWAGARHWDLIVSIKEHPPKSGGK